MATVELIYDPAKKVACMYDPNTGTVFGPLMLETEVDPAEFIAWMMEKHADPREFTIERLTLFLEEFKAIPICIGKPGKRPILLRTAEGSTKRFSKISPRRFGGGVL